MTKKEFDKEFDLMLSDSFDAYNKAGFIDKPMMLRDYNNMVDAYQKSGTITEKQARNWVIPESIVKKIKKCLK